MAFPARMEGAGGMTQQEQKYSSGVVTMYHANNLRNKRKRKNRKCKLAKFFNNRDFVFDFVFVFVFNQVSVLQGTGL